MATDDTAACASAVAAAGASAAPAAFSCFRSLHQKSQTQQNVLGEARMQSQSSLFTSFLTSTVWSSDVASILTSLFTCWVQLCGNSLLA